MKNKLNNAPTAILILAMATGCKKEQADAADGIHVPGECGNTIYMNKSKIDQIPGWRVTNADFIVDHPGVSTDPVPDPSVTSCGHDHVLIDLKKFYDSGDFEELATWLQKYGSEICYAQTNKLIECEHRVFKKEDIDTIGKVNPTAKWTYGKLLSELQKKGISDIENTYYQHYITLDLEAPEMALDLLPGYSKNTNCFSFPLIKSIASRHDFNESTEIEFRKVNIHNHAAIYMSPAGTDFHYNFSQIPETAPFRGFSLL